MIKKNKFGLKKLLKRTNFPKQDNTNRKRKRRKKKLAGAIDEPSLLHSISAVESSALRQSASNEEVLKCALF